MPTFNFKNSLVAGALAAIGASVCCVVPLVLLMMGIGGAWIASLTALEPLRPWFIAATFLFVGLAFRRLYFQQPACEPGDACARSSVLQRQRLIGQLVTKALHDADALRGLGCCGRGSGRNTNTHGRVATPPALRSADGVRLIAWISQLVPLSIG